MSSSLKGSAKGASKGSASKSAPKDKVKGVNFYHNKATVARLRMQRDGGRAVRDKQGNVVRAAPFQSTDAPTARVQPDRRWFGNTRVVGQADLERFRAELGAKRADPYQFVMRQTKLPLGLLQAGPAAGERAPRAHILATESYAHTFGRGAQRKRPRLAVSSLAELSERVTASEEKTDNGPADADESAKDAAKDPLMTKGQSKRIWNELHKVIDSSDVVVHVLDARDPEGTRCRAVEAFIAKEAPHKHLVFVLNKCDLVPASVTQRWVRHISATRPCLAFHASLRNPFGRGTLITLLRQFARLHRDKRQISVGFVGYPNVGKSSVINALRAKAVCAAAPVPGHTRVWQYVTLMKRVSLIDCPGVVPAGTGATDTETVLRGVVRVEALAAPEDYVPALVERVERAHLSRTYDVWDWADAGDFLERLARKSGKLLRGGEPDVSTAARMVLQDWLRGRIPYHTLPPGVSRSDVALDEPITAGGDGASSDGGSDGECGSSGDESAIECVSEPAQTN